MVDGIGVVCDMELPGAEADGAEIVLGEELQPADLLPGAVGAKAEGQQAVGVPHGAGGHVSGAVAAEEGNVPVVVQHGPDHGLSGLRAEAKPRSHGVVLLEPQKALVVQQIVQGPQQLHVGVQIDAALVADDFEPGVVADEGPFFACIGLGGVAVFADIEIGLVPPDDLVIRAVFFPAPDAFFYGLRQGFPAEPAVVDHLWNAHVFFLQLRSVRRTVLGMQGWDMHRAARYTAAMTRPKTQPQPNRAA